MGGKRKKNRRSGSGSRGGKHLAKNVDRNKEMCTDTEEINSQELKSEDEVEMVDYSLSAIPLPEEKCTIDETSAKEDKEKLMGSKNPKKEEGQSFEATAQVENLNLARSAEPKRLGELVSKEAIVTLIDIISETKLFGGSQETCLTSKLKEFYKQNPKFDLNNSNTESSSKNSKTPTQVSTEINETTPLSLNEQIENSELQNEQSEIGLYGSNKSNDEFAEVMTSILKEEETVVSKLPDETKASEIDENETKVTEKYSIDETEDASSEGLDGKNNKEISVQPNDDEKLVCLDDTNSTCGEKNSMNELLVDINDFLFKPPTENHHSLHLQFLQPSQLMDLKKEKSPLEVAYTQQKLLFENKKVKDPKSKFSETEKFEDIINLNRNVKLIYDVDVFGDKRIIIDDKVYSDLSKKISFNIGEGEAQLFFIDNQVSISTRGNQLNCIVQGNQIFFSLMEKSKSSDTLSENISTTGNECRIDSSISTNLNIENNALVERFNSEINAINVYSSKFENILSSGSTNRSLEDSLNTLLANIKISIDNFENSFIKSLNKIDQMMHKSKEF